MDKRLRNLIWIYILLILFDGGLRKWVFPEYSNVIMIIKDVLAAIIVISALLQHQIKSGWAIASITLGCITFITTLIWGHGNLWVALWGCKALWFGIPMCYVIQHNFDSHDVLRFVKDVIYMIILNAGIMFFQFVTPASAWINRLPGGERIEEHLSEYSAIEMAGLIRPPGVFAATTQISLFCTVALGVILFYYFQNDKLPRKYRLNKPLLALSAISYIVATITSTSRTIIFSSAAILLLVFLFGAAISKLKRLTFVILMFISLGALQTIPTINKGIDNFMQRFESASTAQEKSSFKDFFDRTVIYNVNAIIDPKDFKGQPPPFFGFGQGMSSQVGGKLLGLHENSGFALAEWDGLIIMLESGFLLGLAILFTRLGLAIRSWRDVRLCMKQGNLLPLCCYGSFFIGFYLYTQWGNSFQFNFAVMMGGIFLASQKLVLPSTINNK